MGDREWLWMRWLLVLDVPHNPFAHFFRAVNVATLNLNLWGADVLLKTLVNGLTDQRAFFLQVEVLEQHGHGQNLRQWVGDVQARSRG